MSQNDPEVVRSEYADETGLAARIALWDSRDGSQPQDVAFDEVLAVAPRRVLEVGCGRYVAHSVAHKHLGAAVPDFEATRPVTTSSAVFVAER
jgi:hypothetical protein